MFKLNYHVSDHSTINVKVLSPTVSKVSFFVSSSYQILLICQDIGVASSSRKHSLDLPKLLVCTFSAQVTPCMSICQSNYALLPFYLFCLLDHKLLWEEEDIFPNFVCLIFSSAFHRKSAKANLLNE